MTTYLNGAVRLHIGDCRGTIRGLPDASIDSVVTDPPYALAFMGKRWDTGAVAFDPAFWADVLRVLKPGGHVLAMGGTRTFHRLVCAIEDAGFEIRDTVAWLYGSGFPKSHDVSKAIDKRKDWASLRKLGDAIKAARIAAGLSQTEAARRMGLIGPEETLGGGGFMWFETGRMPTRDEWPRLKAALSLGDGFDASFEEAEREVIGQHAEGSAPGGFGEHRFSFNSRDITAPATDAALQWQGWGTAVKPAMELITLARKPLIGTVAANVQQFGTGALNIDECRVATDDVLTGSGTPPLQYGGTNSRPFHENAQARGCNQSPLGRWPANVIHDGSDEVMQAFAAFGEKTSGGGNKGNKSVGSQGYGSNVRAWSSAGYEADTGSAARFFYTAKADKHDRADSKHPTVKPVDLMRYLVRLVTPKGGTVLDPFAGTGTTGEAAYAEGMRAVLCELDPTYIGDIERRVAHARLLGPLFSVLDEEAE